VHRAALIDGANCSAHFHFNAAGETGKTCNSLAALITALKPVARNVINAAD